MKDGGPASERPSLEPPERLSDVAPVLVTTGLPTTDPAGRWLVQLRWVAIVGMSATVLVADRLVSGIHVETLLSVIGALALLNVAWMVAVRRDERAGGEAGGWVVAQIVGDVVGLSVVLWLAGGLQNPFVAFMAFQIALAGLLCTPRATLAVGVVTIGAILLLSQAGPLPEVSRSHDLLAKLASLVSLCGFVAVFVSVYAQRLERLRQQNARNERLATLGRLVGSMSHELNTPLNTILVASQDLERFGADLSSEEGRELAQAIGSEARRAHEIIGLVRGHLSADQHQEEVELCELVRTIAEQELDRLEYSGKRVFDLSPPVRVTVVQAALVQVLVNLLTNAAEASKLTRRPRIEVAVHNREHGPVEVSVEDRGPGFSPEILSRLGEPFQTTKEGVGGTGLGLYVSARLAGRMGAALRVQSVPGGGARVTLSIGP